MIIFSYLARGARSALEKIFRIDLEEEYLQLSQRRKIEIEDLRVQKRFLEKLNNLERFLNV